MSCDVSAPPHVCPPPVVPPWSLRLYNIWPAASLKWVTRPLSRIHTPSAGLTGFHKVCSRVGDEGCRPRGVAGGFGIIHRFSLSLALLRNQRHDAHGHDVSEDKSQRTSPRTPKTAQRSRPDSYCRSPTIFVTTLPIRLNAGIGWTLAKGFVCPYSRSLGERRGPSPMGPKFL